MARPHARNNGKADSGLKAGAHKVWAGQRKQAANQVVARIRASIGSNPTTVASATCNRIVIALLRKATDDGRDLTVVLDEILNEERTNAETLTGNAKERTLRALDMIAETTATVAV